MNNETELGFLVELKELYKASHTLVANLCRLAGLEMQLARKSLTMILFLFFFFLIVTASFWLAVNGLLIVYLLSLNVLLSYTLLVVIGINAVFMMVLITLFGMCRRNMSFPSTRKQLKIHLDR